MKAILFIGAALLFASSVNAQTRRTTRPASRVAKPAVKPTPPVSAPTGDRGEVSGRTYTNRTLGFEITFPDTWLIPGDDFEAYMKSQGFDISPKPPKAGDPTAQKALDDAFKRLNILLTVYKLLPGSENNAITRIAVEDLTKFPQIRDAVDYVDAVRQSYVAARMPTSFKFSETQAEQLGKRQFAFIDLTTPEGKSRMYVTLRDRRAILFRFSYLLDEDLATFRDILSRADFALK